MKERLRQWCVNSEMDEQINAHDEERSGRSSVQTDEIVFQVDQKLRSDRRLMISALADEFPLL